MKKRILIALGILILAAGIGAGGWYYYTHHTGSTGGSDTVYVTKISKLSETDSGVENRYAGVVEPQETVQVKIESGRKVKEVQVKTGEEVKKGQLLFQYDLGSIQQSLQEAQLALDRLKNESLSISDQITTLEAEKKKATADNQLSYTIEIETQKMNLKKNEYDQKSKQAEIEKLSQATQNTEVRSEIDGVIQKIDTSKMGGDESEGVNDTLTEGDSSDSGSGDSSGNAFITILSTGAYRVKGTVNEINRDSIIEGTPVIIRSRVDSSKTWKGTMGAVDMDNSTENNSSDMAMYGMSGSSDDQTSSSTYPFYVNLDSSDGLMLGQHVYIEADEGQDEEKIGIWLNDYFIVDADLEKILNCGYVAEDYVKESYAEGGGFDSLFFMNVHKSEEELRQTAEKILNDPSCGAVFRVKGFLKKEDGQWLELNATRHEISIRPTKLGQEIMIVIGEKLNKEVIDGYWK